MRTILTCSVLMLGMVSVAAAQTASVEPAALTILNHMADNIGALHSCRFHLDAAHDVYDAEISAMVKRHDSYDVYLVGPNKMLVNSTGDGGHRGCWYDGKTIYFYSYDENNYARVLSPPTILAAIDSMNEAYGIDFPGADFISPTFVKDLLTQSKRVVYRKTVEIGGKDCFHVVATGPDQDWEIWVANDATGLPVKYVIRDKGKNSGNEYEGQFSDWQMNPDLPSTMFDFPQPPGAHEVKILARNAKQPGGKP